MSEAANELSLIRRYLLGALKGEEREQLEERVLLDAEFKNKVLMVEENLIEDYADGTLEEAERQGFERMFQANPQRRLEVRIVENLKQQPATGWWTKLLRALGDTSAPHSGVWGFRKPAVAFAVVVAVAVALFVVQRFWRSEPTLTQEQQRREQIERALARLNSPQSQPAAVAATLAPGLLRGDDTRPTIEFPNVVLARDAESAQLILLLKASGREYRSFQAMLTRIGTPESYKVDLTPVTLREGARALVLTIPAHLLGDGDYRVELSGLPDHYYYFRLVRQ